MKCHILFSGKNKKYISICHLLKILPKVLSVKDWTSLSFAQFTKDSLRLVKMTRNNFKHAVGPTFRSFCLAMQYTRIKSLRISTLFRRQTAAEQTSQCSGTI